MDLVCVSLKTLPVANKEQQLQARAEDGKLLDADLVEEAAKFLKGLLGLTVFGFDVVVSIFADPANFIMLGGVQCNCKQLWLLLLLLSTKKKGGQQHYNKMASK